MIEILLASYNGEKYIREQIMSVVNQSYSDWHLTVCDDCSKDNTVEIVKTLCQQYPDKITLKVNKENSGSASGNFYSMLIESSGAKYVMLCDQDDVWDKDKVKVTKLAMDKMEERYGKNIPLLVHSDLRVVDDKLEEISSSMFYSQNLKGSDISFANQLCQNSVTGCTVMVNKSLLGFVKKKPDKMIMHDWWLALIASAFGRIGFINTPLISYRQHSSNQEGAKDFRSLGKTIEMAGKGAKIRNSLNLTYEQAISFRDMYGGRLNARNREVLNAYCNFPKYNKVKKLVMSVKYGFTKSGLNRKIGYWLYV